MSEMVISNEFLDAVVATQCDLTGEQVLFLRLIKERGARLTALRECQGDQEFQILIARLKELHEQGIIPSFEVILE